MGLLSDTGITGDSSTFNPTLVGMMSGSNDHRQTRIEFDHFSDGTVDGVVTLDEGERLFTYDPRSVDPRVESIRGAFSTSYRIAGQGAWETISIGLIDAPRSNLFIDELQVEMGGGRGDHSVQLTGTVSHNNLYTNGDQRIVQIPGDLSNGYVTGWTEPKSEPAPNSSTESTTPRAKNLTDVNLGFVAVEVDFDHDGHGDKLIRLNADLGFQIDVSEFGSGPQQFSVRVAEWNLDAGDRIFSSWSVATADLPSQLPTIVSAIVLESDRKSSLPSISGWLEKTGIVKLAETRIDFDSNGDGVVDGWVLPDGEGHFSIPWT